MILSMNGQRVTQVKSEKERKRGKRRLSNAKLTKEIERTFVLQSQRRLRSVPRECFRFAQQGTAVVSLDLDIEFNCLSLTNLIRPVEISGTKCRHLFS